MCKLKSMSKFHFKLLVKVRNTGLTGQFELTNSIIRNVLELEQGHYRFKSYIVHTGEVHYSYAVDFGEENHQPLIETVTDAITEQQGPCVSLCDILQQEES